MNTYFDPRYYGEIYLYQYAHACPRISVYRGDMQGFKDNTKIEVRHTMIDCPDVGCGYWLYYMKGSGVWIDLGKTKIFSNHYDAVKYFMPNKNYDNQLEDLHALTAAAHKAGYDTLQFLSNNEYDKFLFEILDTRSQYQKITCPPNTNFYYQFAQPPYTCSCQNGECINCYFKNKQFEGNFPPCNRCQKYKFNNQCLNQCPKGTKTKEAFYAEERFICLSDLQDDNDLNNSNYFEGQNTLDNSNSSLNGVKLIVFAQILLLLIENFF